MIAKKQQELIKKQEAELSKYRSDNERLTKEVEELREERKTLSTQVGDLQGQVQDQAKLLAEKEFIIMNITPQFGDFRSNSGSGGIRQQSAATKDFLPISSVSSNMVNIAGTSSSAGDYRTNFPKTPTSASSLGKENKTPFLHPKYSSRT